jgi:hypothetical protein
MINLSDTVPAAPTGGRNIKWQQDSSGDVSGYTIPSKSTVTPSGGVVTIDASTSDSFLISVTAAITSIVINNPTDGQRITLLFAQDATGHAVTLPASLISGTFTVTTTANKHSCAQWLYNSGDTNWYIVGQNNL